MNAYRILMIVLGIGVIVPQCIFLFTLRTGRNHTNLLIGRAVRLQAIAIALIAVGTTSRYLLNSQAGSTSSAEEKLLWVAISTIAAIACWQSLYVFFKVRTPIQKPQEAESWTPLPEQQSRQSL